MGDDKGVVLFGPWIGEFGWELMAWQAWCRKEAKKFDKAYVCSFPDMGLLYEDFAEFIPHNQTGRALDWDKKENIDKVQFEMPDDITVQLLPFKRYKTDGEFVSFVKMPIPGYAYLLHARAIGRGGKDYPLDRWTQLASALSGEGTVASIGSERDHLIPGTADMRSVPLQTLADIMAGCECVIGGSSGTMHFASLCAPRLVTWGDNRTYFGETLGDRYEKTWNPLKTPVKFIYNNEWNPDVSEVVQAVSVYQNEIIVPPVPQLSFKVESNEIENLPLPRGLRNNLIQAAVTKRYFITVSKLENGKLYHYYTRQDFPTDDMMGSLLHVMNEIKLKEFSKSKQKAPLVLDDETPAETGVDQWT
jgi:hypothetical protein